MSTELATIESRELVTTEQANSAALALSNDSIYLLRETYYPEAPDDMIRLMHGFCVSRGVDHCMKPGYIVKAGKRWSIWPSIHLYRVLAHRSMFAGTTEPEYGPTITIDVEGIGWDNGQRRKVVRQVTGPEWVKMKIKRVMPSGHIAKFHAKALLREFAKCTDNWVNMPDHMLTIRCEAIGLRAAFPEVGGAPTWEEMRDRYEVEEDAEDMPTADMAPKQTRSVEDAQPAAKAREPHEELISAGQAKLMLSKLARAGVSHAIVCEIMGRDVAADLSDVTKLELRQMGAGVKTYLQVLKEQTIDMPAEGNGDEQPTG